MSKKEKALANLHQNPKNVRFEELEKILIGLGFTKRQAKGSHTLFRLGEKSIIIPRNKNFIKEIYIKRVILMIDEIERPDEL